MKTLLQKVCYVLLALSGPVSANNVFFEYQMVFVEEDKVYTINSDQVHKWSYEYFRLVDGEWKAVRNFKTSGGTIHSGALTGRFLGESGRYKIRRRALPNSPYECEFEFDVNDELNDKVVNIPHTKISTGIGYVRILNESGVALKDISVQALSESAVFINDEKYKSQSSKRGVTNEEGYVKLKYLVTDAGKYKLKLNSSAVDVGPHGSVKSFSREQLDNKFDWVVSEKLINLRINLFHEEGGKLVQMPEDLIIKKFGKKPLCDIYEVGLNNSLKVFRNECNISLSERALVFRGLPYNKDFKLSNKVRGNNQILELTFDGSVFFQLEKNGVYEINAIVSVPVEKNITESYNIKIRVTNDDGDPVKDAVVRIMNQATDTIVNFGKSDEEGRINLNQVSGSYQFQISALKYQDYIFNTALVEDLKKDIALVGREKINIKFSFSGDEELHGEIFGFNLKDKHPFFVKGILNSNKFSLYNVSKLPILFVFHSRPVFKEADKFIESSNIIGLVEVKEGETDITIPVAESLKIPFASTIFEKKNHRIILYLNWEERLIPVGIGYWSENNQDQKILKLPKFGTYTPLLIIQSEENENVSDAYWAEDIHVESINDKVILKPIIKSKHKFIDPFYK